MSAPSLLILGALLLAQSEAGKPISKEVAKPIELYTSAEMYRACVDALLIESRARREYIERPGPMTRLRRQEAVAAREAAEGIGILLRLDEGAQLEVSSNPGQCSVPDADKATPKMLRVRITSGSDAGKIGCVVASMLRDPVAF